MPDQSINNRKSFILLWKTFDEFWTRTSISGISNAGSAKSAFRRTCWMLTFTLFLIITFIGFGKVLYEYFEYPVITSVIIEHQDKVSARMIVAFFAKMFEVFEKF